jgi:uroporphyrinogen-III synthase
VSAPPILVVRPQPGSRATMRRLASIGLSGRAVPLFRGEPLAWSAPPAGDFDALMLTSANVLRHGGDGLSRYRSLPLWAVGAATADAAIEAGFTPARVGTGGVAGLLAGAQGRILWLCGEERTDIPVHAGLSVTPVPVYRMAETPADAVSLGEGGIILLHSARAARRVSRLLEGRRASFTLVTISAAVAAAAGAGWRGVEVAPSPSDAEMVAVAARLCQ